MRYIVGDILCTIMTVVFAINYLTTGRDTALIMTFLFWILSELYRIQAKQSVSGCRIPKVY